MVATMITLLHSITLFTLTKSDCYEVDDLRTYSLAICATAKMGFLITSSING